MVKLMVRVFSHNCKMGKNALITLHFTLCSSSDRASRMVNTGQARVRQEKSVLAFTSHHYAGHLDAT